MQDTALCLHLFFSLNSYKHSWNDLPYSVRLMVDKRSIVVIWLDCILYFHSWECFRNARNKFLLCPLVQVNQIYGAVISLVLAGVAVLFLKIQ